MNKTFTVFVDDNFHYMDESKRYKLGEFETVDKAVGECKRIVDEFLLANYGPGATAEGLFANYTSFGEDPFIVPRDETAPFSAWDYARQRCSELCGNG